MGQNHTKPDPNWKINKDSWTQYENVDMCGQGDVEIIHDWRQKYSIEDLQKIVEQKGYSAISVGSFGHAALKKFNYQLKVEHCKPSNGYINVIHIFNGTPGRAIEQSNVQTPGWQEFKNMDMCGQGDVEFIKNWRNTHTVLDLRRIAEEKGYSAFSIGAFDFAAFKKFDFQLTYSHCKPSKGYTNSIHIFTPTEKQKLMVEEKKAEETRRNASQGWAEHVNMDMCGQGDVEFIKNWRSTHSIEDLKKHAESKGYSAFSIGGFDFAAFKKFEYQLNIDHCKPSKGYTNSLWIFTPSEKQKIMIEEKKAEETRKNASEGWEEHVNMDMCGQGDVEFIKNWRNTHSLEDLKRHAENKGYSAFSIGGFDFAAFKKFDYQLNIDHCKPSKGYTNSIWIYNPEMKKEKVEEFRKDVDLLDQDPDVAPPPYSTE